MAKKQIVPIDDKVRVIPADKYDTIEFGALAFKGIGGGDWFGSEETEREVTHWWAPNEKKVESVWEESANCPICINGLAVSVGIAPLKKKGESCLNTPAKATGISIEDNDNIVDYLVSIGRYTRDADGENRVSFADYCEAGNIVRGE